MTFPPIPLQLQVGAVAIFADLRCRPAVSRPEGWVEWQDCVMPRVHAQLVLADQCLFCVHTWQPFDVCRAAAYAAGLLLLQ